MERLAKKIAESIGESLGKTDEDVAVVAYGLIGILQFLAIFLLASTIGFAFSFWTEVVVVFLSVGFLRRLTGGAHSKGIYSCLVYSVCGVCGIAALACYVIPRIPFQVNCICVAAVFIFGYIMIALKAPVAPPNKPCRSEAKRKRLRRGSFTVLSCYLALIASCFVFKAMGTHEQIGATLYSASLALAMSTMWQILMMTRFGHGFIAFFDGLFIKKSRNN